MKNLLEASLDADAISQEGGMIHTHWCVRVDHDEENNDESARPLGERFKERLKVPLPIYDHFNTTGHHGYIDNLNIVCRKAHNLTKAIKDALFTRVNDPFLNRNIDKYNLLHVWEDVLFKTPELKLK